MWSNYDSNALPIQSLPLGYALGSLTYITSTGVGSYTTPAGARMLFVRGIAGGGAGGGASQAASYAAAGGGSGGDYAEKKILAPVASYSVSVGAGGTQPTAGNNPGNVGGDTVFKDTATLLAKGGLGGAADTGTTVGHIGGIGGDVSPSAAAGDFTCHGQPGGAGVVAAASQALGGFGGAAGRGYGAGAIGKKNTGADGNTGSNYGGGGSGSGFIVSGTNRAGGAGGPGIIIVEEFY